MFDGLFSYRNNMRLKSPCEIASDMTLWFSAISNFRKNGRICDFHWTFKSKKCLSLTPRPGALPLDPAGSSAPDPRSRLALCALPCPPSPNPKYATGSCYSDITRKRICTLLGPPRAKKKLSQFTKLCKSDYEPTLENGKNVFGGYYHVLNSRLNV